MAEKIDIAELNFDTDRLTQNVIKTRVEIDQLRGTLTELRKGSRDTNKSISELTKKQEELAKSGEESTKEYKENADELKNLKKQQVDYTSKIVESEKQIRSLSKEQRDLNKIIEAQTGAQKDNTVAIESATKASENEVKTIAQARSSNTELLKLRNDLDISGGKNADKLAVLNKALDRNNAFIKENVSAYEQQKIGIGDYKTAIEDALGGTNLFGVSLNQVKGSLGQFEGVFKLIKTEAAAATAGLKNTAAATEGMAGAQKMAFITTQSLTAGLKLFRIALVATGIGAIVVILGSLIAYLSTTQAGIDAVTSVTRPLSAVFQTLLGIMQNIGGDIFKNPLDALKTMRDFVKKQLVESFTGLGKVIAGIFTFDRDKIKEGADQIKQLANDNAESLKRFAKGIGDQFDEAWKKGKKIDELQKEQEKLESEIAGKRAKANDELRKQENIYKDQTLSVKERNAAADEAKRIAIELQAEENKILELEIQRLEIKQSLNDTSREDLKLMDELRAKLIDNNAKVDEIEKKTLSVKRQAQNEANKAAADAANARIQEALDLQRIELDTFVLLNEKNKESIQDELDFARELSTKKVEILKAELAAKKISQAEYDLEILKNTTELSEKEAEIAAFYSMQLLNQEILNLEERRAEVGRLTIESVTELNDELIRIADEQAIIEKEKFEAGLIDRHEFNEAIKTLEYEKNQGLNEINDEWRLQNDEDEKLRRLLENEEILLNLEDRFERERELANQNFQEKQIELENQLASGLISEANFLKATENLNASHSKAMQKIDAAVYENKVKLASDAFGQLASIAGEQSAVGKAFAVAQATIDTYSSAVSSYNSLSGIPIVGPVLGGIAAAAAIASGLGNVKKIISTNPQKKYTGGYTGDGGVFEKVGDVHAGEVVFSQRDISALGGVGRVEAMRPTSDTFGSMPTGVPQERNEDERWEMIASVLGEGVERGSKTGTETGMVEAGENDFVRQKATF